MDKIIIAKVFDNILSLKCRTELTAKDKKFIEQFEQEINTYPKTQIDRLDLFNEHVEIQEKHKYTQLQSNTIVYWGDLGHMVINGRIYKTKHYKEYLDEMCIDDKAVLEKIRVLQSAIDESPRVPKNTITFREGHWNPGHKKGEVIVQKGFASTSYDMGNDVSGTDEEHLYYIKYYVPMGTKGLVLDTGQFDVMPESELLLGRNTRQYILSQDDTEKIVDVLILPNMD